MKKEHLLVVSLISGSKLFKCAAALTAPHVLPDRHVAPTRQRDGRLTQCSGTGQVVVVDCGLKVAPLDWFSAEATRLSPQSMLLSMQGRGLSVSRSVSACRAQTHQLLLLQ